MLPLSLSLSLSLSVYGVNYFAWKGISDALETFSTKELLEKSHFHGLKNDLNQKCIQVTVTC
jgi:hypothetical protein